jgi:serine/threonine protein kinase
LSEGAKDLISKLLQFKSEDRLSLEKVLEHDWIQHHLRPEVKERYAFYKDNLNQYFNQHFELTN